MESMRPAPITAANRSSNEATQVSGHMQLSLVWNQLKILFSPFILVPFVAVPTGIILHVHHGHPKAEFFVNFVAIAPLASILNDATEEVARHFGETIAGFISVSFGFVTEHSYENLSARR